jgi:hypothetical protein
MIALLRGNFYISFHFRKGMDHFSRSSAPLLQVASVAAVVEEDLPEGH